MSSPLYRAKEISSKLSQINVIDEKVKKISALRHNIVVIIREYDKNSTSVILDDDEIVSRVVKKVEELLNYKEDDLKLDLESLLTNK